jgi:hypothetical protein
VVLGADLTYSIGLMTLGASDTVVGKDCLGIACRADRYAVINSFDNHVGNLVATTTASDVIQFSCPVAY